MIYSNLDFDAFVTNDSGWIRAYISHLSDEELFGEYALLKHVDNYNFYFGGDDCPYLGVLFNYGILICEEIASRAFSNYIFNS